MRTRILVVGALAVAALLAFAVVVLIPGGPEGPTADDRSALADVVAQVDEADRADAPEAALAGVTALAGSGERWPRLVAGGGDDLAELLDRAQPALGLAADPAAVADPVVAPFVAGDPVDHAVVAALGRWTWPVLAAAGAVGGAAGDAAAGVLAQADAGDDERDAVTAAVGLARVYRILTGGADADAVTAWRSDLAGAALGDGSDDASDRTAALLDGEVLDLPAELVLGVLAAWGPSPPRPTDAARAAIAGGDVSEPAPVGSALTVAAYLAAVDDRDDTAAAEALARLASGDDPLTADRADLAALEDALLTTPDPALAPISQPATALLSA
ncbi:MAG TPA: hypothetical protein VK507_23895 [Iamia sp.]|nr:hypothetical protein [Iamia sp.]